MLLPPLEPWSNLTFDEIYHEDFQQVIGIIFMVMFVLSCIVYPLTVYIIFTKSTKEMGKYKYLLIYHITWEFLCHVCIFTFKPWFLFPLPICFSSSYFQLPEKYLFHFFALGIGTYVAATHALFMSFSYRAGVTFISGPIAYIFSKKLLLIFGMFLFLIVLMASFVAPIMFADVDIPTIQAAFIEDVPMLAEVFRRHPMGGGFHPNHISKAINILIIAGIFSITLVPLCFVLIHLVFTYRIKKLKKLTSIFTYKIHKMLYRAMVIQLCATFLLFLGPLIIFVGVYLFQIKDGSIYANIIINIGGSEMIVNAAILLYFIKPYRQFVLLKLNRLGLFNRIQSSVNPSTKSMEFTAEPSSMNIRGF